MSQLETIYGWTAAQAWSHLGITLMNGHTDQPSELFAQSDFSNLLAFAQADHPASFSFWSANRDFQCPAGAVEPWNPGTCSGVTQSPYDYTKVITAVQRLTPRRPSRRTPDPARPRRTGAQPRRGQALGSEYGC